MEIARLTREMEERKRRLKELEKAHTAHIVKAKTTANAQEQEQFRGWTSHSRLEPFRRSNHFRYTVTRLQKQRDNILLALQSDNVPFCMTWSAKGSESFFYHTPHKIKNDREIMLARLALEDFGSLYTSNCFEVPPQFWNDKEIMMTIVSTSFESLQYASQKLKNDPEVVLAAIGAPAHCAPKAIEFASAKIRATKKIVQVALNRDYGLVFAYPFIGENLQKDKRLVLAAIRNSSEECNRSYEILSILPTRLRKDKAVVLEAVKKRGSNLRHVACPYLMQDFKVALAACQQDGGSIAFVPDGPTKQRLLDDPEYVSMIVANGGYATLYEQEYEVEEYTYGNSDLLLAAVQTTPASWFHGIEEVSEDDNPLFLKLFDGNSALFSMLPDDVKSREDVARASLQSETLNEWTARRVFSFHQELKNDTALMKIMAEKGFTDVIQDAPQSMHDNKSVMTAAVTADISTFSFCSDRLQRDPEIVTAAIRSNQDPDFAFTLPKELLKESPTIAAAVIHEYDGDCPDDLLDYLPRDVFQDRHVLLAWLGRADWPIREGLLAIVLAAGRFWEDREVLIAGVKYCGRLTWVPSNLRRDRSFLKACIEKDGRILFTQDNPTFQSDFELMLIAIGSSRMSLHIQDRRHHPGSDTFKFLAAFAEKVRKRLHVFDTFVLEFLRGIANVEDRAAPSVRCHLPMLDHGGGTAVKHLIADFADVPIGEVSQLRAALQNLEFWGY